MFFFWFAHIFLGFKYINSLNFVLFFFFFQKTILGLFCHTCIGFFFLQWTLKYVQVFIGEVCNFCNIEQNELVLNKRKLTEAMHFYFSVTYSWGHNLSLFLQIHLMLLMLGTTQLNFKLVLVTFGYYRIKLINIDC